MTMGIEEHDWTDKLEHHRTDALEHDPEKADMEG
jgi:hypothetical protein